MRGHVNSTEIKMIAVYVTILLPIAVLCYENKLSIGNINSIYLFIVLLLMLLTYNIEIPLVDIKTKKEEKLIHYSLLLEKLFSIPIYKDLNTSKKRIFNTKISINMAGAFIPFLVILYIISKDYSQSYMVTSLQITLIITALVFLVSDMIDGVGIIIPKATGLVSIPLALILNPNAAANIIFISSTLGIIIGSIASILKIDREKNGSAYLSIGGVGTFQAIYISIIVASLISYI